MHAHINVARCPTLGTDSRSWPPLMPERSAHFRECTGRFGSWKGVGKVGDEKDGTTSADDDDNSMGDLNSSVRDKHARGEVPLAGEAKSLCCIANERISAIRAFTTGPSGVAIMNDKIPPGHAPSSSRDSASSFPGCESTDNELETVSHLSCTFASRRMR